MTTLADINNKWAAYAGPGGWNGRNTILSKSVDFSVCLWGLLFILSFHGQIQICWKLVMGAWLIRNIVLILAYGLWWRFLHPFLLYNINVWKSLIQLIYLSWVVSLIALYAYSCRNANPLTNYAHFLFSFKRLILSSLIPHRS